MWFVKRASERSSYGYWSGRTHGGHRSNDEAALKKYASELLDLFPERGTLVDVGCGSCQLTTYLAVAFAEVFGVDFSDAMLAMAQSRIKATGSKNIKLLKGAACDLPPSIGKSDVIMSYALIQYLSYTELNLHLKECSRRLKPNGVLCIAHIPDATKNKEFLYGSLAPCSRRDLSRLRSWLKLVRLRIRAWWRHDPIWDGIGNWYSRQDMRRAAIKCGYRIEFFDCSHNNYRFHAVLRIK